ncbi:MAG: DUF3870 domain-containing protein [Desulfurispora sp.]|uniref:DUF3870 domain-containing protein n=1 Tax=Desulfurispora sp. TaxID=3014275 RepID=UPI00404AF3C3
MNTFTGCVYVTGNARSPERSTVGSLYEVFAVELVINLETDIIEEASCTLVTELGRNFVRSLLVGRNAIKELEVIIHDINDYYCALPQKTLITALKDAHNKYKNLKAKRHEPGKPENQKGKTFGGYNLTYQSRS